MKKFLVFMLAMLWMSVAAFSQITISQEDYDKLPSDTRTQIEKITTEKAIKGEIKEVSEYASLGKEIGVAVNETLKAVEDSAISQPWKVLNKFLKKNRIIVEQCSFNKDEIIPLLKSLETASGGEGDWRHWILLTIGG